MLVHLAWNEPLATRFERVRRVRHEQADFLRLTSRQRVSANYLLDKYTEYGISSGPYSA